jgi:hypothetical protein
MRKILLSVVLAIGFTSAGGSAPFAMQKTGMLPTATTVQPVVCFGIRRDYRNFNQCWRINARARGAARYCSRICG